MGYRLSQAEIETYHRDGLVIPNYRLPDDAVARLRAGADRILNLPGQATPGRDWVPIGHLPDRPGVIDGAPGGDLLFDVATTPDLVDMVEQLLGPDIILWASNIFGKPARTGKPVQWHQDGHYFPVEPMATLTAWIAIDDATPENGCLRYIPGSHRRGLLTHTDEHRVPGVLSRAIWNDAVDESSARDVCLKAGQFSLHHVDIVHGSNANTSGQRRAGFVVRYMPATSLFVRAVKPGIPVASGTVPTYATRPIFLLRGQNRHPGNDVEIGHENLADLDQLVAARRPA